MEPIQIINQKENLRNQLTFLMRKGFQIKYGKYKKLPLYLFIWTVAVMALSTLTSTNSFITLKAVSLSLTALAWLICLIIFLPVIVNLINLYKWKNNALKAYNPAENYFVNFDEKKLICFSDTYRTELEWEYYSCFDECKGSLYIFPHHNIYEAFCCSKAEIGEANYETLKKIVIAKLPRLNTM
jgi:hypothetical protein